jgi:hypothetical protein
MKFKPGKFLSIPTIAAIVLGGCNPQGPAPGTGNGEALLNRTVLPINEPEYKAITELDARKAAAPARFEVKAPENASMGHSLIDDTGFGHSSASEGLSVCPPLKSWLQMA